MQNRFIRNFLALLFVTVSMNAQYTEIINTYRPGVSQGAFSVGKNVIQVETGLSIGTLKHSIFDNKTNVTEFEYLFRAGLFKEQLELSIQGSYLRHKVSENIGDQNSFVDSGFPANIIGAKYLLYDPYKYERNKNEHEKLLSWKKSNSFQWSKLIPAVAIYAGASFSSRSSDFAFQNNPDNRATEPQSNVTPKVVLSAQNNWAYNWVFVFNAVGDRLTTEFPDLRFVLTSTYNINDKWSIFGEYENANSKIYKDHLLRIGGTYLITNNFAVDAHLLGSIKDTPRRIIGNVGLSYRLDYHKINDDERILTGEQRDLEKVIDQIKSDIEDGHLPPETMTGKLEGKIDLEDYVEEEVEDEEFDNEFDDLEETEAPKKKGFLSKLFGKRKRRKKAIAEAEADSTGTIVSSKPVLGSGGRMTDFVDEDFIKNKQEEITPEERTAEELAEIELRNEERRNKKRWFGKKKRKKNDTIPEPDYSGMSRKEIKEAKKQQKELDLLEKEVNDLDDFINQEVKAQETRKEKKRREREERKLRKQRGRGKTTSASDGSSLNSTTPAKTEPEKPKKKDPVDEALGDGLFDDIQPKKDKKEEKKDDLINLDEDDELKKLEAEIKAMEAEKAAEEAKEEKKRKKKEAKAKKKKKKNSDEESDE